MASGKAVRSYLKRARRRWRAGRERRGIPEPTEAEHLVFSFAFRMGWKARGRRIHTKGATWSAATPPAADSSRRGLERSVREMLKELREDGEA